jgi:hypothetical protein
MLGASKREHIGTVAVVLEESGRNAESTTLYHLFESLEMSFGNLWSRGLVKTTAA